MGAIKRSNQPKWNDVFSLFQESIGSKFVIPVYQRNYVWEAKKQVNTLLQDFYALIGNNKNHFLGIIIDYLAEGSMTSRKYYVIDGQQRLTTLFLLLKALEERAITENNQDIKAVLNLCLKVFPGKDDYKLEPLMNDGDVFKTILNGDYKKLSENDKETKVAKAYDCICNFIFNTVKSVSLEDLTDALSRLYLVDIPLDKDDNAQQIFETINFNGSPLLATDLIRNYVLMCTDDDKKEHVFTKKWQPFESKFTDSFELEKFFRYFVMCQNKDFIKKNDVYDVFRDWIDDKLKVFSIEDVIDSVDQYADCYNYLYKKDLATIKEEQVWKALKDYRNIKSEMPAPLMLEIVRLFNDNEINSDQFTDILNVINSFILRRAIIDMDTSGITRFFTTAIRTILSLCDSTYSNIVDVVRYCVIDDNKGKSSRMPDDAEISQVLETLNVYDMRVALHCFFDRYENEKVTSPIDTMNYQIEHIMPQDGTKWFAVVGLSEDEYNAQTGRLGNLTLTTKHANPTMSNNLFEFKQVILKDVAAFRLNVDVYNETEWNKEKIDQRNKKLITEILRLYPYEGSLDKNVYDEMVIKNRNLPKMDKMIEWGIVSKGDKLCLAKYKESSIATLVDSENVEYDNQILKISQWINKVYGIGSGINPYKEIYIVNGVDSLDSLRKSYMSEHPVESDSAHDGAFRKVIANRVASFLKKRGDELNDIEVVTEQKRYIRFVGLKTRNRVGLAGDGSWDKINDLIVYEVYNAPDVGPEINLYIGPGDRKLREKWFCFALNSKILKPKHLKLKGKWNCINSYKLAESRSHYENDEQFYNDVMNNLGLFFENDFKEIENEFDCAPTDLDSRIYCEILSPLINDKYDEEYHLEKANQDIKDLYNLLKIKVLELNEKLVCDPTKVYISYKYIGKNVIDVEVYKSKLRVSLNIKMGMLNDPEQKCRDITNIGTRGNGDYDIKISNESEIQYLIYLIKQVIDKTTKN